MVTAAAVAIPMGTGQANVRAAVADKAQGEAKTFAESLGETAELELFPGTAADVTQETAEPVAPKGEAAFKAEAADGPVAALVAAEVQTVAGKPSASVEGSVAAAPAITASSTNVSSNIKSGADWAPPARPLQVESVELPKASSSAGNDDAVVDRSALSVLSAAVEPSVSVAESEGGGQAQSAAVKSADGNVEAIPKAASQTAAVAGAVSAPASVSVVTAAQHVSAPVEQGITIEKVAATGTGEKQPVSAKKASEKKQGASEKTGVHQQDTNAVGSVVVNAVQPAVMAATPVAAAAEKAIAKTAAIGGPRVGSGKEVQPAAYKGGVSPGKQNTTPQTSAEGQRAGSQQDGHVTKGDASVVGQSSLTPGISQAALKAGQETVKAVASVVLPANDGGAKLKNATTVVGANPAAVASGAALGHVAATAPFAKAQGSDGGAQPGTMHVGAGESGFAGAATSSTPDVAHRTLSASPTTLEVGVPNGTEGWLKIRAEMASGGGVNASLSAASPAGQEMLHRELPSLTAFLQQERVAVNTVVVHPLPAAATVRAEAGGMSGGAAGQMQQRSGQGGDGGRAMQGTVADRSPYPGQGVTEADEMLPPLHYAGGGSWLSVRA